MHIKHHSEVTFRMNFTIVLHFCQDPLTMDIEVITELVIVAFSYKMSYVFLRRDWEVGEVLRVFGESWLKIVSICWDVFVSNFTSVKFYWPFF